MKFDFAIGNPPYMESAPGTSTSDIPVYHIFMDAAYEVADKVELITPSKFLSNAGRTPAPWNKKMLNDPHFKILQYESNAKKIFPSIDLPGGVAISYRDSMTEFIPIGSFSQFEVLKEMADKIHSQANHFLPEIIYVQNKFNLEQVYNDYPDLRNKIGSQGKDKRFRQKAMERFPQLFTEESGESKLRTLGLISRDRAYRYIDLKYVEDDIHIKQYKVFVPFSNGASGTLGDSPARLISKPVIGLPYDGITQTFIGVGGFETYEESEALLKYIKTRFARCLLGLLKVTQGNKQETWAYVPLQDFTSHSDIDWTQTISDIDKQLYKKYKLNENEINFIMKHVEEMA